jgi:hypothetical protein
MSEGQDSFAEDVFEGVVGGVEEQVGSLDSWDDAESYVASEGEVNEEANAEGGEISEEASMESRDESSNPENNDSGEAESEDNNLRDEDSKQDNEEGKEAEGGEEEVSFEIPEQLAEKGIVASEEGDIGKMVKVDGEMQFVSLEELGNDYSGQKALQQRFTEFDRENKAFKSELDEVNGYVNNFREKMQAEGAMEAMSYLGEFTGMAPYQIKRQLMEQLAPEIDRLRNMSNAELQAEYATEEKNYLQKSIESEREEFQAQQAQGELEREVISVRETHGIDDSEWDQAISFLREHEQAIRNQDPNVVMDANYVAETILDARAYDRAESAIGASSVNLSESESGEILSALHEVAFNNPDFTQEDLVDLVKSARSQAVETKVSKDLGNRVEKHGSSASRNKSEQKQENITPSEAAVLDDLWG